MNTPHDLTDADAMMSELRSRLRRALKLQHEGVSGAKLAREHGYIDGFMRVLLDTRAVTKSELLAVVADERARASGPATTALDAAA
ncbi:MAG: hypothetical protein HRU17_07080 [Polyangiaceae bacterium]|nr:hypothetical protein [Polyangiaceae bacterium]